MTQPTKYFQGFEGARKVQSMMIDFPEIEWLERERPIKHMQLYSSENPDNNWIEIFAIGSISGGISRIYANDTETKIFVAPESEGFFNPIRGDEYIMDVKPHPLHVGGCPDFRSGKRIYMPQTDTHISQ